VLVTTAFTATSSMTINGCEYGSSICDPLRDNPAHPAKIDFLFEAIIVA